jgi:hypothetical protein
MLTRFLSLTLLVVGLFPVIAVAQTPAAKPTATPSVKAPQDITAEYAQMVERVKKGDMDVDFIHLRDVYGVFLCDESARHESSHREEFVTAVEAKNYAKVAELVEEVLDYEFVHVGIHRVAQEAYQKINNQAKATYHKAIADKLIDALLHSGDGKTQETAYRVLRIQEEYFIMDQLGFKVGGQALIAGKTKVFDMLFGEDPKTKQRVERYFDITSFFGGCKSKDK